jgi:predicted Zn-dependent protease
VASSKNQAPRDPARAQKWLIGEITLRELVGVSDEHMRKMALKAHQWLEQARFKDARAAFEGLVALEPRQSYFWSALGAIDLAEKQWVIAERRCSYALTLNDRDAAAYVNRGEAYVRLGKLDAAAADLRNALALDPKGKSPLTARARALALAVVEAIAGARKARGEAPAPRKSPPRR